MNQSVENNRILLVDDDLVLRTMAAHVLATAGFAVAECDSGESCLALLAEQPVDLVLLDVLMPGIDGFETCRRLRANPATRDIAVVMLTGLESSDSIETSYQVGASDFVTKPIGWDLLVHRIRYNLRAVLMRHRLVASEASLADAQRLARLGSWQWWPREGRFECSDQFARMFNLSPADRSRATPFTLLQAVVPDNRAEVEAARRQAVQSGTAYNLRFHSLGSDGGVRFFREELQSTVDPDGQVSKLTVVTQDISVLAAQEEKIRFLTYHDQTTELPTRQYFVEVATHVLEQAARNRAECAVLYIDLDRFSAINAFFGNETGNEVLRTTAQRIVASIRAADIAGYARSPEGLEVAARAGGDEFLVMLSQPRRELNTTLVADRLLEALRAPIAVGGETVELTASIGIALFPRDGDSVDTLLEHAEYAMRNARNRRDSFTYFDDSIGQAATRRIHREAELRRAIGKGEMVLHFQPKVDTSNGRIIGAEALVRWQHPEWGLLPPGEFIPLAEDSGLIVPLGQAVFSMACAQVAAWQAVGIWRPPLVVAVNLSAASFIDQNLVEQLLACTRHHGVAPASLCLEVTETALMENLDLATSRLIELRAAGFRISLDDFGTGYSSLNYLKRFPVDQIKIDRSFVSDITSDDQDAAIVAAIVTLASKFGLELVAEGTETLAQVEKLRDLGCTVAQGYYFARPMPAEQLGSLLASAGRLP